MKPVQVLGWTFEDCTGEALGQLPKSKKVKSLGFGKSEIKFLFCKQGMAMLRCLMLNLKRKSKTTTTTKHFFWYEQVTLGTTERQ